MHKPSSRDPTPPSNKDPGTEPRFVVKTTVSGGFYVKDTSEDRRTVFGSNLFPLTETEAEAVAQALNDLYAAGKEGH